MLVFPSFLWVAFSLSILPEWFHPLQPEIHDDSDISTLDLSWAMNQYVQLPFDHLFTYGYIRGISKPMCLKLSHQYNSELPPIQ